MLKVVIGMYGPAGVALGVVDRFAAVRETQTRQIAYHSPTPRPASTTVKREFVTKQPIAFFTPLDKWFPAPMATEGPFSHGGLMGETVQLANTILR